MTTVTKPNGKYVFYSDCEIAVEDGESYLVLPDTRRIPIGKVIDPKPATGLLVTACSFAVYPAFAGLRTSIKVVSYHIARKPDLKQWFRDSTFFRPVDDDRVAFLETPPETHKVIGTRYLKGK